MSSTTPSTASRRTLQRAAGALVVALLVVGSASYFIYPPARQAAARQADNLLEMLEARSPGVRETGELTKIKAERPQLADEPVPEERALGKVFGAPPPNGLADHLEPPTYSLIDGGGDTSVVPPALTIADFAPTGTSAGPVFGPPVAGNLILPPGGGGAIASPPVNPVVPTPETPAVPEPSTWSVLIAGFAMCAAAMRKRRWQALSGHQVPCA